MATAFPHAQVELWATDENRIGLKPVQRRVWAPIGQRPIAIVQHRYAWRYVVGFVHPASGRTFFHLATGVSIPLFEAELSAFARTAGASPRKQIVLAYSPELQPAEHLWPLTNAVLINQHFATIEELEEVQLVWCAELQRQPPIVQSTTCFHWWPRQIHRRRGPRRT